MQLYCSVVRKQSQQKNILFFILILKIGGTYDLFFILQSGQNNQCHPWIGAVQITVTGKDRKAAQQLPARTGTRTELLPGKHAVHLALLLIVTQLPPDSLADGSALAARAITVNQGQNTIPLQSAGFQFHIQTMQSLLNRGQAAFKIDNPLSDRTLPDRVTILLGWRTAVRTPS